MYRHLLIVVSILIPLAVVAGTMAFERLAEAQIGHMVFFKLKESSPEAREKLVAACKKYLANHDDVVYFSVGTVADEFNREVNDREWDVALHVVFANKAAHDKYQEHPRHIQFIEENRETWANVRVFDSHIEP